ncbi:MAG: protein-L-isoaspartate O-methyltransferase [Legionellaceae bacterium]|nr:protein-L-isoaspartate O-methyltransferase [Legionellaceae bacterium]
MNTQIARVNMIKQQLRTGDVLDESILELYQSIPRDAFVPAKFKDFAYSDMPIELPNKQLMMTPLEEALILQALHLTGHEVVLEVGTGTGFLTTLLSRLCKHVISIDYYEEFTAMARKNMEPYSCNNVALITGDASQGWVDKAPYEVIVFSGALEGISEIQRLQLLPGGKLIAIIGKAPVMQAMLLTLDHDGIWTEQILFETNLPPLIDKFNQQRFVF